MGIAGPEKNDQEQNILIRDNLDAEEMYDIGIGAKGCSGVFFTIVLEEG